MFLLWRTDWVKPYQHLNITSPHAPQERKRGTSKHTHKPRQNSIAMERERMTCLCNRHRITRAGKLDELTRTIMLPNGGLIANSASVAAAPAWSIGRERNPHDYMSTPGRTRRATPPQFLDQNQARFFGSELWLGFQEEEQQQQPKELLGCEVSVKQCEETNKWNASVCVHGWCVKKKYYFGNRDGRPNLRQTWVN